MRGDRLGSNQLLALRDRMSGRDFAILRQVAELKLLSARQIEAMHFPAIEHRTQLTAARACRRTLERLHRERALIRLERRIGGIRAGSASAVYAIGPIGERLIGIPGPRHRHREPSLSFLQHTLAIGDVVVALTSKARSGVGDIVRLETEPTCWRAVTAPGGGTVMLRPDLFVAFDTNDTEYRWFAEVDLGTEHLPTMLRKCAAYEAYYRSGHEQAKLGVFPRVVWIMHSHERVERLRAAIDGARSLTRQLFVVTLKTTASEVLTGGLS